jgi:hypothetical protein
MGFIVLLCILFFARSLRFVYLFVGYYYATSLITLFVIVVYLSYLYKFADSCVFSLIFVLLQLLSLRYEDPFCSRRGVISLHLFLVVFPLCLVFLSLYIYCCRVFLPLFFVFDIAVFLLASVS